MESELFSPQLTRPSGGEFWFAGSRQEIRWTPSQLASDSLVTVELICPDRVLTIGSATASAGTFDWVVPDSISSSCHVRISGQAGHSVSNQFKIRPSLVLNRLDIGGSGWHPAGLRDRVLFTSDRQGSDDIWMIDRRELTVSRLTSSPGTEDDADFFKPNGTVFAYSADMGEGPDIWMMPMDGPTAFQALRVTTAGGRDPVWQPSFFSYPALAYHSARNDVIGRSHIFSTTLGIRTSQIIPLPDPVPVFPEVRLTSETAPQQSLVAIRRISWGSPGNGNEILIQAGDPVSHLWRIDVSLDSDFMLTGVVKPDRYVIPEALVPVHPAITISGSRIAFIYEGDLWVVPRSGSGAVQLTSGSEEDAFPDWASETEIVFQRRLPNGSDWEIWTLDVPDL